MAHSNIRVAQIMGVYDCSQPEAEMRLEMFEAGESSGRDLGRAEAQRFFRLALGVDSPSAEESALWNNPVPLKGD